MEKVLLNTDEYDGQYVALISAENNTIFGVGKTPEEALSEAKKKGYQNPFLIYVPDKDLVHIYYVEIIKDLSSPHVEKLITYAEHLKTIENKKSKSSGKIKRIKVPTLHLGHIGKNAADRDSLYKEYLNYKLD